ncbi:hypothetical protein A3F55_02380 [Candidatus Adlerbacteria bacterium RIFCSPHIGHO2_12_FULL_53_18]|uniref:POTRA domain-containing protein n=1 Tax=Candidatus Adlerbacteria bacterium RIFCSPHIGHO2_12_FULL_53_18 TaxID=1797242 RepID=A0A1F4XSH1_9BACT|nr:MAG: hypothetical protein A3F55_02380 [Candidatus Adlerbacteria bacterium RIFCSPHIGHO2_12_FULL_53_18]
MARFDLPQSKLRTRRRKRRVVVAILWFALIAFFAGGVVGLTYLPHLRVVEVSVEGVEGTEAQAVERIVREHLEGRYVFVFPRNNVLIYPRSQIVSDLHAEYPIFATVEVRAKNLRTLHVVVAKRTPEALWCGEARAAPAPCFLLDEQGVAYELAAQSAGLAYTTYYGSLAGGVLPRQYLAEDPYRSLTALAAALEAELGTRVASVEVDHAGDVRLHFAHGFEIIFVLEDGGGDVYERFVLALQAQPFKEHPVSDFAYLDLRFGDRLYYKLK